jgi:hypothetical protein
VTASLTVKVAYLFHQHHTPRELKAFLVPKQFIRITYIPEGDIGVGRQQNSR